MSSENQNRKPDEGSICWIEIPARDLQKLKSFYSSLFPEWEFQPGTEAHPESEVAGFMFKSPKGLGGGIVKMPEDVGPHTQALGSGVTIYHFVHDLEKTESRIHELGGKTLMGKTAESTHGFFMNMADPEGNRFGIYQLVKGDSS